jgi:uncharacterized protein YecE (DUF72 family)
MTDARNLHPALQRLAEAGIYLGTSSWKYPGWCGQLYTEQRYLYRGKLAKSRFEKGCLEEYAEVFPSVCVDASFYRFPGAPYLEGLAQQVPDGFLFSHKVTDTITMKHFPRHPRHGKMAGQDNPHFLDANLFLSAFLKHLEPHRGKTGLIIFEFTRFYPRDYEHGRIFVDDLESFLDQLPTDQWDFGVEIRNASFLQPPYFEALARHRVGHVYNQWQRMPSLAEQLSLSRPDREIAPVGSRLLLKCGRDYETAVESFAPYDQIREEQPEIRQAAADLIKQLAEKPLGRRSYLYVNNRLEGNALTTIEAILNLLAGNPS